MKKVILILISGFVLIGLLIAFPLQKEKPYTIKSANTQEVVELYNFYKDGSSDYTNYPTKKQGESLVQYDNKLFLIEEYSLLVFNLDTQQKEIVKFNDFQPLELIIADGYLYIIGVYDERHEINFKEDQVYYDKYVCEVLILEIETLKEIRYIRFNEGYYATSFISGNDIYIVVHIMNVIDEENDQFIFPSWFDSSYGNKRLREEALYLSSGDKFNNVLTLIVRIDSQKTFNALGIIGVEGYEKIIDGILIIASPIYDSSEQTAFHFISLVKLQYLDYLLVKGYLITLDSYDIYQNYFKIAMFEYQNEEVVNKIEIFDLITFSKINSLMLPQNQYFNYLEFNINTLYFATYDTKAISQMDLKSGTITTNALSFYVDKIIFQREYLDIYGQNINQKGVSTSICVVRQDYSSKLMQTFVKNIDNLYFDASWNSKVIRYYQDIIIINLLQSGNQKVVILKNGNKILFSKLISIDDYCQQILFYNDSVLILTYEKIYQYSIETLTLTNTYLI